MSGLQSGDTAECGGYPDRATGIGPIRHVCVAVGNSDGRSAGGTAWHEAGVERIDRRAEVFVHSGCAERQLIEVDLADDDRSGRPRAGHASGVLLSRFCGFGQRPAARRGRDASDIDEIFDSQPDAVASIGQPGDERRHPDNVLATVGYVLARAHFRDRSPVFEVHGPGCAIQGRAYPPPDRPAQQLQRVGHLC